MSEILDRAPQERVVAQRLRVGEHPAGADLAHRKRYEGVEDERIGDLGQDVAPRLRRRRAVPVPEPGGRIRDDHALVPEVVSQRGERLREEQVARAGAPQGEHVEPGRARREHLGGAEGSAAAEELRATVDREHVPARERRPLEGERLVLERHVARGDEGEMAVREVPHVCSHAPARRPGDGTGEHGGDDAVRNSVRGPGPLNRRHLAGGLPRSNGCATRAG